MDSVSDTYEGGSPTTGVRDTSYVKTSLEKAMISLQH